jgi:hypothetical protein
VIARVLIRLGGLLIVAAVVYLPVSRLITGQENFRTFRNLAGAGMVSLLVGGVLWVAGRGMASIVSRSCPRCGRRVARGRVYCDDHLQDTINEYRDRERGKGR